MAGNLEDRLVQLVKLREQRGSHGQHGLRDLLRHRMASHELADARFEGLIGYLANFQAETPENATKTELGVPELVLKLLARNQQGTLL